VDALDQRFLDAVQHYWEARARQKGKQEVGGRIDAGTRGAVTGGTQMGALEVLVVDLLEEAGLKRLDIRFKPRDRARRIRGKTEARIGVEIPGYYRAEKEWDLLVVADGRLVTVVEFKSQVGPSFGNNLNNRVEEAVGSASDLWTAFREERLGRFRPFLGYVFLLEDCAAVHRPVKVKQPYFPVDEAFQGASYGRRYEVLCRRLVLERLYDAVCLALTPNASPTRVSHPADDLNFRQFAAKLQGHARAFAQTAPN